MKKLKNQIQLFSIITASFWSKDLIGKLFSSRDKVLDNLVEPLFCHHIESRRIIGIWRARTNNLWSCLQLRDWTDISINNNEWIDNPAKRVFSGIKAILDFDIINFREYDCSKESGSPNCQIVELFLTVDTTRKMQNGVNIDKSIDRCEFFWLLSS